MTTTRLKVLARDGGWVLTGADGEEVGLVNDYLGHLRDRHYAPGTRRSYAFDLLAFCRWLLEQDLRIEQVDAAALLRFLASCHGLAPATINRRLAAVGGLFGFRTMRDPAASNPMPRGPAARRSAPPSATACWGIWPDHSPARRCASGSRGRCPAVWGALR